MAKQLTENQWELICENFTRMIVWRRFRCVDRSQLYQCRAYAGEDLRSWILISHDFSCKRVVLCGGNAGMSVSSRFQGDRDGLVVSDLLGVRSAKIGYPYPIEFTRFNELGDMEF